MIIIVMTDFSSVLRPNSIYVAQVEMIRLCLRVMQMSSKLKINLMRDITWNTGNVCSFESGLNEIITSSKPLLKSTYGLFIALLGYSGVDFRQQRMQMLFPVLSEQTHSF